jgi:HD superfamily phosphohydrolase
MERLLRALGLVEEQILQIASLIIGRPYGLMSDDRKRYHDFVKSIISGDMDADKIDYVARDAYFAGIPIAADVERLISQLDTIDYSIGPAGVGIPDRCDIVGVLPSGIAAAEMFIITRSYLFDRIYQHPKIRAAERQLERFLLARIESEAPANLLEALQAVFNLFYTSSGDDGCIHSLNDARLSGPTGESAVAVLERRLPRRAIALSRRFVFDFDFEKNRTSRPLYQSWALASDALSQNTSSLEGVIKTVGGIESDTLVIVDWPRKVPIKENPEIYVSDPMMSRELINLNQFFDASQLSKAYEDVKKLVWIFTDHENIARVAAGAALVLCARFGIVPNDEALTKAKVDPSLFDVELEGIRQAASQANDALTMGAAEEVQRVRGDVLRFPAAMLVPYLRFADLADRRAAAVQIAGELEAARLVKGHFADVETVLPVLECLTSHCSSTVQVGKRYALSLSEADFQRDVVDFVRSNQKYALEFEVDEQHSNESGRVDVVIRPSRTERGRVAVELKAEEKAFDAIIKDRISQSFHYSADSRYLRIAVLYVRFRSDQPLRPASLVRIYSTGDSVAPLVVICLGQQVTGQPASRRSRRQRKG